MDGSAPNLEGILSGNRYRQSLKMVKISCSVSKSQQLKFERWSAIRPKIALLTPVKIRGGVGEICGSIIVAAPVHL